MEFSWNWMNDNVIQDDFRDILSTGISSITIDRPFAFCLHYKCMWMYIILQVSPDKVFHLSRNLLKTNIIINITMLFLSMQFTCWIYYAWFKTWMQICYFLSYIMQFMDSAYKDPFLVFRLLFYSNKRSRVENIFHHNLSH